MNGNSKKVALVTGAGRGIGKASACVLAKAGMHVFLLSRTVAEIENTQKQIEESGGSAEAVVCDVSDAAAVSKVFGKIEAEKARLDVLINNAGISMRALFKDVDLEVINKVMDINFFGAVYATHSCLPHLIKSHGSIVGISSIAGYRGLPGRTGYSSSKFALNGFLEALRTELIHTGVHVLTACPGFTASNIRKLSLLKDGTAQGNSPREEGGMMTAEECAKHIYNATVRRRKTLVLTRQGKLTVFLNKWAPGVMDRFVYNTMAKEENSPFQ